MARAPNSGIEQAVMEPAHRAPELENTRSPRGKPLGGNAYGAMKEEPLPQQPGRI